MPILLDRINWGCSASPWFIDLADEAKVLARGRRIILELWPYIRELPVNIASVRDVLPAHMTAARQLLNRLGDDERQYQQLFIQQFELAGLSIADVEQVPVNESTKILCELMSTMCRDRSYVEGIHAIVAAELAATMYCRSALPSYERFFEKSENHDPGLVKRGLEWLRLHAKTHTRHAIWMKRMLFDLNDNSGNEIPEAAEAILNATLALWECPSETPDLSPCRIS